MAKLDHLPHAKALIKAGNYAAALPLLADLARAHPRNADVLYHLGVAQNRLERFKDAERTLKKAIRAAPEASQPHYELAFGHRRQGLLDQARAGFERALALSGQDANVIGALADLHLLTGNSDAARDLIAPHLDHAPPNILQVYARLCARSGRHGDAIDLLTRRLDGTDAAARSTLLFRLTLLHDAVGDYDAAFACAAEANALLATPFDARAHAASIDRLIDAWTPVAIASLPRAGNISAVPIFIVGMPRSGTSLIEQALDMHPLVHGAGERTELAHIAHDLAAGSGRGELSDLSVFSLQALDQAAADYLTAMSRIAPRAKRVTDKAPFNFAHLGLIQHALPGAHAVHCTRDPRDTALSIFFQHFTSGPVGGGTLEGIAAVFTDYQRLMAHWQAVLELPIHDVAYEDLIDDQEGQTRALLDALDLEFDEACLRFHESTRPTLTASAEQVRQPIYRRAVGRWKNYERQLQPLEKALGARD